MIADFDVVDELHEIAVPVDIVAAEHDGVGDPGHMTLMAPCPAGGSTSCPGHAICCRCNDRIWLLRSSVRGQFNAIAIVAPIG
jgi:uncharacterized OB-fold protein